MRKNKESEEDMAARSGRRKTDNPQYVVDTAQPTRTAWIACAILALATIAVYANTFTSPFILDDDHDIVSNLSIRRLWPISSVFLRPSQGRVSLHNRPVVVFSFAVNYAMGGLNPLPYHLTNLAIHVLAGLTLFGIARRTFCLPSLRDRYAGVATPLAFVIAAMWALHPLATQAVTYIVQRYESMMGLFYLLSLYCVIRGDSSRRPGWWAAGAAAACALSMACKEVAVSIPLVILLYDRAFLAGSFRAAWQRRWRLYLILAAAWGAMIVYWMLAGGRGHWAGFGLPTTPLEYARTQLGVILHYLRLSFWPYPQVFDYDWRVARTASQIVPGAIVVGGLLAATGYALIRWPKWGVVGAWFFLILAPTSSIMPIADLAFEHRMYLSLAAVVVAAAIAGYELIRRLVARFQIPAQKVNWCQLALAAAAIAALGATTYARNQLYRDKVAFWSDVVAKAPHNARAYVSLAVAMTEQNRGDEALAQYRKARDVNPQHADAYVGLASVMNREEDLDEAIRNCRTALALQPRYPMAHYNLAALLFQQKNLDEAARHFHVALTYDPYLVLAHVGLGNVLVEQGSLDQAKTYYQKALDLDPQCAAAHLGMSCVLGRQGNVEEAVARCQQALKLAGEERSAPGHYNLGNLLERQGKIDQAIAEYEEALAIDPRHADALYNQANCLAIQGNLDAAVAQYRKALETRPKFADAHYNLANALLRQGKLEEAVTQYQATLAADPRFVNASIGLVAVLSQQGQLDAAIAQCRKALEIAPQSAETHHNLASILARQGKLEEAVSPYLKALELNPALVRARFELGKVFYLQGKDQQAAEQWQAAIRQQPGDVALLNAVAWEWATCPKASVRNGTEAVRLADRAVELTGGQAPEPLDTQAAAYAETGRFTQAVAVARRASELAAARGNAPLAQALRERIKLYESSVPFRDRRSSLAGAAAKP